MSIKFISHAPHSLNMKKGGGVGGLHTAGIKLYQEDQINKGAQVYGFGLKIAICIFQALSETALKIFRR